MILLYKNKCFFNGYDVFRALQEQLSTHKKQEQRNGYQTDQLTFRDAHHYSNDLFKLVSIAIIILHLEMLNTQAWIHIYIIYIYVYVYIYIYIYIIIYIYIYIYI